MTSYGSREWDDGYKNWSVNSWYAEYVPITFLLNDGVVNPLLRSDVNILRECATLRGRYV